MTLLASLPRHLYCYAERSFLSQGERVGFERCSWFGLVSVPNRAWGLTVLLENGGVFTNLPPHAIAFSESPEPWTLQEAQRWDCFGYDFAVHCYDQLADRDCEAYIKPRAAWLPGQYLFTAQHHGDSYSAEPEQSKQFHFIRTAGDRLTALPGNCVLFHDPAFTRVDGKPTWLRTQTERFECEARVQWDGVVTETSG